MSDNKVKIVGRNFSDDLVGLQFVSRRGTPIFTTANFDLTTKVESKSDKIFKTNKFSDFISLDNLDIDSDRAKSLQLNNLNIFLNLDITDLTNFAYFGSLKELFRVSFENIIMTFPAGLFINKLANTTLSPTVENYVYDVLKDEASFSIDTNKIINKLGINYLKSGIVTDTFLTDTDNRNISVNFSNYAILKDGVDYNVIGFTGSTNLLDDTIFLKVNGNPFPDAELSGNNFSNYHIKPQNIFVEEFFNGLDEFENILLNRLTKPKFTSTFSIPIDGNTGNIIFTEERFTWPSSDGYNIDFNTPEYDSFALALFNLGDKFDQTKTDIIQRFLVTEPISNFDTIPAASETELINEGQKITKLLRIYGREFDEIKKFIDGLSISRTISYNKRDNAPDSLVKYLTRALGWELTTSLIDSDILSSFLETETPTFSGQSRGLTKHETEVGFWRRILLNSHWLWKSKGTRKAIETIFDLIGSPEELIKFKEYVYSSSNKIDINFFKKILKKLTNNDDVSNLNIDEDGFPKVLPDSEDMYFQKAGLWYRETAGNNSNIDVLIGNNPHIGPYDGGNEYINQFRCLIPDFSSVTLADEVITTKVDNLFTNYNNGIVNGYTASTVYVRSFDSENESLTSCSSISGEIINDHKPQDDSNECGCEFQETDLVLKVNVPHCETKQPKAVLGSKKASGGLFQIGEDDGLCNLEIEFDYLFQYNCDDLLRCKEEIIAELEKELNEIIEEIQATENELERERERLREAEERRDNPPESEEGAPMELIEEEINELKASIAEKEEKLEELNAQKTEKENELNTLRSRRILTVLDRFDICVTIEKDTRTDIAEESSSVTTLIETVHEESLFKIDTIEEHIKNNKNTGLFFNGGDCDSLLNCIIDELGENCSLVTNDTFNSDWLHHKIVISDPAIINKIKNRSIFIGFLTKETECEFSILLDNIKLNRVCVKKERDDISIITKCPSFEFERVIDNKKSWVFSDSRVERAFDFKNRDTKYFENHSKLIINTKEINIDIDPAAAIECDVFNYYNNNDCIVTGNTCLPECTDIIVTGCTSEVTSSQRTHNWIFGDKAGIDFNPIKELKEPTPLNDSSVLFPEGCTSISDTGGTLLFYSDGETVYNKNHQPMPDGVGLNGNKTITQSAIAIPKPGSTNIYYLFTLNIDSNGLQYSEIDMSLDGGLGDVTTKNVFIHSGTTEKMTAVEHSNGTDFWLVTHEASSDKFLSNLISSSGVNLISAETNVGSVHPARDGYMKISPDGKKLGLVVTSSGPGRYAEIFDFDTSTGKPSNPIKITKTDIGWSVPYGLEFSPDSTKLYISDIENPTIWQLNLGNSDIVHSKKKIGTPVSVPQALQLTPDGNIFVAQQNKEFIGIIAKPNSSGSFCKYYERGFLLDIDRNVQRKNTIGLPNFIVSFFKNVTDKCVNDINYNNLLSNNINEIKNSEEFINLICQELIDAKTRKVIGGYPLIKQLYDRYLNSLNFCNVKGNEYDYSKLNDFVELIGTHWVDLVEQLVPATTIWGSTYVYRNTLFDKEKFKYKSHNTFLCCLPNEFECIAKRNDVEVDITILPPKQPEKCLETEQPKEICEGVCITDINDSSEFIGRVKIIGEDERLIEFGDDCTDIKSITEVSF